MLWDLPSDIHGHIFEFLHTLASWESLRCVNRELRTAIDDYSHIAWRLVFPSLVRRFPEIVKDLRESPRKLQRICRLGCRLCDFCGTNSIRYFFAEWQIFTCYSCVQRNTCDAKGYRGKVVPRHSIWGVWLYVGKYGQPHSQRTAFKRLEPSSITMTRQQQVQHPPSIHPRCLPKSEIPSYMAVDAEYNYTLNLFPLHPVCRSQWLFLVTREHFFPLHGKTWFWKAHKIMARNFQLLCYMCHFYFVLEEHDIYSMIRGELQSIYHALLVRHITVIFSSSYGIYPKGWSTPALFEWLVSELLPGDVLRHSHILAQRMCTVYEIAASKLNYLFRGLHHDVVQNAIKLHSLEIVGSEQFFYCLDLNQWYVTDVAYALVHHIRTLYQHLDPRRLPLSYITCGTCKRFFGKECSDRQNRCKYCCLFIHGRMCESHKIKRRF